MTATSGESRRLRADLALVCNTVIWGSTFVLVKQTIEGISPLLFLAFRFSIATLCLLAIFPSALRRSQDRAPALHAGAIAGVFLFGGYAFQTFGLRLTSPAKSAFITGLSIPAVPLVAALVYRIRPRLAEIAGILCATIGLGLMTLEGQVFGISRGDFLTLLCAISFAAHIVTVGHYAPLVPFETLAVAQLGVSALLCLVSFPWVEPPQIHWTVAVIGSTVFTGIVATALTFTVQAWAQQYTTSTRTALIYALEPVFAWVTAYIFTGETLSSRAVAGAFLILAGILLVELKPATPERHPSN
jgi:drug/metabolite transporter (DMT)-like permease